MNHWLSRSFLGAGALLAALLLSPEAAAQSFEFNIDEDVAQSIGLDAASIENDVQASASDQFQLIDQGSFLRAMANASAVAVHGLGVDYASNPKRFVVGAGLGTGVSGGDFALSRGGEEGLPSVGAGFQVSLMGGLNLGLFTGDDDSFLNRVTVYGNGLAAPLSTGAYNGSVYNFGAHAQLALVTPKDAKVAGWGGLALTTGFTNSTYALGLAEEIPITVNLEGQEVTWKAAGTYEVVASASQIPLELSTNVHLLKVVSLFGGGGVDIGLNSNASSEGAINGPINTTNPNSGEDVQLGTAKISISEAADGSAFSPRFFGGVQLNVLKFRLYGQLNYAMTESEGDSMYDSYGGNFGIRFAL